MSAVWQMEVSIEQLHLLDYSYKCMKNIPYKTACTRCGW